jgi:hypothetical protein
MRKLLIATVAACGVGALSTATTIAAPADGAAILGATQAASPVEQARLYCHRGATFLHWGPCWKDRGRYAHPNYYCHRGSTFLHWGRCRGWE